MFWKWVEHKFPQRETELSRSTPSSTCLVLIFYFLPILLFLATFSDFIWLCGSLRGSRQWTCLFCSGTGRNEQTVCDFCVSKRIFHSWHIKGMRRFIAKTPNALFFFSPDKKKKSITPALWEPQKSQLKKTQQHACRGQRERERQIEIERERWASWFWHGLQKVIKIFSFLFIVARNSSPGKANQ